MLVTAGPVSETELSVCLYMASHYKQHGKSTVEWSYTHHRQDTQVRVGKQFNGLRKE